MIQMGVATRKKKDLMGMKIQVCSRDAVCFMHKKVTAKKSRVQELDGDHLFQCEHAWVNMLQATPAEIPPEGLCTRSRCYQEARKLIDDISQFENHSYLKKLEHLLAKPLQVNVEESSLIESTKFAKRQKGSKNPKINSTKAQRLEKAVKVMSNEHRNEIITKLGTIVSNIQQIVEIL